MKKQGSVRLPPKLSADSGNEPSLQGIWSGTVSFSLVAIPVHLIRAVEPGRVSFRLLHSKDYSPLLRRMVCPDEEKIVPPDEIIRGYEIGSGKHLLITDEELESVSPERSRTIEIIEFIDMEGVDPIYYDHPYYLIPSKGGEKSYSLLAEVMRRTNKAGLAKFVLGEREYLVAVKSTAGALSLITLHYSDEILPDNDIAPEEARVESAEKDRMKKVIREMIAEFKPDKYANDRRKKILDLLKKKVKEKVPVEAPEVEEEGGEGPADLIAMLQQSMRKVKKKR
ncbi:MAG TPA: Ku protein [Desulfomonilia bacterium]|nr:Ku protein [Desulfomonilia bacterium]